MVKRFNVNGSGVTTFEPLDLEPDNLSMYQYYIMGNVSGFVNA